MRVDIGRSTTWARLTPALRTASGEANCTRRLWVWHVLGSRFPFASAVAFAAVAGVAAVLVSTATGRDVAGAVDGGVPATSPAASTTFAPVSDAGALPLTAISGWQIVQLDSGTPCSGHQSP